MFDILCKSESRKRIRVGCEKGGRKYTAYTEKKKAREVLGCRISFLETDQLARDPVEKGQVEKERERAPPHFTERVCSLLGPTTRLEHGQKPQHCQETC